MSIQRDGSGRFVGTGGRAFPSQSPRPPTLPPRRICPTEPPPPHSIPSDFSSITKKAGGVSHPNSSSRHLTSLTRQGPSGAGYFLRSVPPHGGGGTPDPPWVDPGRTPPPALERKPALGVGGRKALGPGPATPRRRTRGPGSGLMPSRS